MTPKKVLLAFDHYYPYIGGAELVAKKLSEGLVANGWSVTVVTRNSHNSLPVEIIEGVRVVRVKSSRYLLPILSFLTLFKESKDCNLIHTSTYCIAPAAWLVAKIKGCKVSIIVHELLNKIWYMQMPMVSASLHRFAEWVCTRVLPYDKYIAVSEFTRTQLICAGIKDQKIKLIYNGVDKIKVSSKKYETSSLKAFRESSKKLVFAGRIGPSKGLDVLLESLPLLQEKENKIHVLLILGNDPIEKFESIVAGIKKKDLSANVTILPSLEEENFFSVLQEADAFIVPSLQEGFGIFAAQLSSLGKVVIHSGKGSLEEVVFGKAVCLNDLDPESIVKGIQKALRGEVDYIPDKDFSWDDSIKKYLDSFSKMIVS